MCATLFECKEWESRTIGPAKISQVKEGNSNYNHEKTFKARICIVESQTNDYQTMKQCYNEMIQFQGLSVLCDSAREPLLTCTALLWRKMVPRFLLFQGSNRHSSVALFIKHKLLKTVWSLVLMSTQAIFITVACRDKKKKKSAYPPGPCFSFLSLSLALTWSKKQGRHHGQPQTKFAES